MLTLPPFTHHAPTSVDEALALLAQHKDALLIAGGTDLVPNMKHGLRSPAHLVSLRGLSSLAYTREENGEILLGATTLIQTLADDALVKKRLPALAEAAAQIAGPQLRRMGTLGGNLCLDTRCVYINQTHFWRRALGFCLKKDGTVCHVVKSGKRCVAAASNDTAPVLMTLGASVVLQSKHNVRRVPLTEFYVSDGIRNTVIGDDEILVEARIPAPRTGLCMAYEKLRQREAIDFPALGVAVTLSLDAQGLLETIRLAVTGLAARPQMVRCDDLAGRTVDEATAEAARHAFKQCHPLTNINIDPEWRREMIPIFVRRAIRRALSSPRR